MEITDIANKLIKIMNSDITLQIYAYIKIFGSTTPSTMRNTLDIKKTSVFRSLELLHSVGIIEKEVLEEAIDGSKQAYVNKKDIHELNKLIKSNKMELNADIYENWENTIIEFPSKLNKAHHNALMLFYSDHELGAEVVYLDTTLQSVFDSEVNADKMKEIFKFLSFMTIEDEIQQNNDKKIMGQPVSLTIRLTGAVLRELIEDVKGHSIVIHRTNQH